MSTINTERPKTGIRLTEIQKYAVALGAGLYIGTGGVPESIRGYIYLICGLYCIFLAFQSKLAEVFAIIPYLAYNEIIIRANDTIVPNLYAEYVLLAVFGMLILKQGTKITLYSRSFVFIFLYALVELIDCMRTNEPDFARLATINSFLLFFVAFWSASNKIPLKALNRLLLNFQMANIYLCGNILAIHIFGHVSYSNHSSSASTNSLAPVQVSGYVGLGTILFFLSIFNRLERKKLIVNVCLFVISCTVMILSFSRGGLYFLAVIVMLYLFFNRKDTGSYFIFLLLVPVGFLIYYYVTETTGGLIIDRYTQAGSSGRDVLVDVGLQIFRSEPLAGIGTGNFSKEIVARHLYEVESGAHNEFIRAAAEHGILGVITYWGFYICMAIEALRQKGFVRQFSVYFFALFCLIMVHNGLKISIQHLLLILVICRPLLPLVQNKRPPANAPPKTTS